MRLLVSHLVDRFRERSHRRKGTFGSLGELASRYRGPFACEELTATNENPSIEIARVTQHAIRMADYLSHILA